ncbi:MAG TPA: MFS transporter, partial [Desulfobacteria bacterium]|nr:MFS transporter [Desulfobacteria bacterium]
QRVIPETKGHEIQPFDIRGAVLFFVALISILIPLSYTEKVGWHNPYLLTWLIVGVALLVLFVILENRTRYPMIDMSLFKNRLFSLANFSALLNYIALFSTVFIMPFYLQQLRGMPPDQAGMILIPMPLATMIVAPISGAVSDRVDSRYISSLGMAVTSVSLWMLSNLKIDSPKLSVVFALIVLGTGSGLFQTPNNSAVMGTVPPNRRGIASGLLASMRNVGMVLGVAISGAVFSSRLGTLTKGLAAQGLSGTELGVQAFTGAMHLAYTVSAGVAAFAILTSLTRGPNVKPRV